MLPEVIIHNGISVDGRMDHYSGDLGLYYELAGRLAADAVLSGSETILAGMEMFADDMAALEDSAAEPPSQILAIVDSRGRVPGLHRLRRTPYWSELVVLCSEQSPAAHVAYLRREGVPHIVTGQDKVDLRAALQRLHDAWGVRRVRVDSGGVLNGLLLRAGLVNEVSLLVHPALVGGRTPRSVFVADDLAGPAGIISLQLLTAETMPGGHVWLRYEVVQ